MDDDPEEYLEIIVEARVTVAGLGLVTEVQAYFQAQADKVAKAWLTKYAPQMNALTDDRKESYRQIIEMSTAQQNVDLTKPEFRYEATKAREANEEIAFPTWKNHLLCAKDGKYPAELNDWERRVVETESRHKGFRFWYRNRTESLAESIFDWLKQRPLGALEEEVAHRNGDAKYVMFNGLAGPA